MITLPKISNKEIIDVIAYSNEKAIIVEKVPVFDIGGQYKVNYFVIDFETKTKEVITKNAYLLSKFGSSYKEITDTISNYVECDSTILDDRSVLIIYPNAQAGIFDQNGKLSWNGVICYNDNPVFGLANDGEYFWSCCKEDNCVVRYRKDSLKVDLRVGGKDSDTFINPCFVSSDEDNIYVCCDENKVRIIDRVNFTVSDYISIKGQIRRFYKFGKYSIVCLSNGAYLLSDNDK
jgi:hypothetical protein